MLLEVLHIPGLFTNLISGSELLKKGYYLYGGQQTVNSCADNIEIASAPVQDELFTLRLYKEPKKIENSQLLAPANAAVSSSVTSTQRWHRRLGHPGYANFKRFDNVRGIDISKLRVEKDLL